MPNDDKADDELRKKLEEYCKNGQVLLKLMKAQKRTDAAFSAMAAIMAKFDASAQKVLNALRQ